MRIARIVILDSETLERLYEDSYEYAGPVALAKGGMAKTGSLDNMITGQQQNAALMGTSAGELGAALPFYESEITNPSGFGQPALNAMTTEAGQGTSGSLSNATQAAKLRAARSGNLAGESGIIANASRNAANANANADLGVQIANAQEKLKQQQQGAAGVSNLYGEDLKASLQALGLSDESINAWSGANKSAGNLWSNAFLPLIEGAEKGGTTVNV